MSAAHRIDTSDLVARLLAHPLYAAVSDERSLRLFMATHVFCVWDFQCLLKALQRALTCVEVPWLPTPDPAARRLVNEIVLDEESDEMPGGGHLSHYELYRLSMADAGADGTAIDGFLAELGDRAAGVDAALARALARGDLPPGVAAFTGESLRIARRAGLVELAATFTWGREDVIPEMFGRLVGTLARREPAAWSRFRHYLQRHIERDGQSHRPAAHALMARLCGDDAAAWAAAESAARTALQARLALWDALLRQIDAPDAAGAPEAPAARAPGAPASPPREAARTPARSPP
jgi:hypothetical protein